MSISSSTSRCIQFSLEDIKAATNQFDESKLLGKGGEAVVYYGEIYIDLNKTPVAVKRLKNKRNDSEEFISEINTLSKIKPHPNIVSLIGYCDESGQKILVYEYMEKGSQSGLLRKKDPNALNWMQRLTICLDVARGLQHLHSQTDDFSKGIIHRDMKPENILVGENWIGKVSDFGMFKLSTAGQEKSTMTTIRKGTPGYFAPEYCNSGIVTRKIDVFSFGVVLFNVLCEKSPWDRDDESYYLKENDDLGKWALENIDAQIRPEISGESVTLFTDIIRRSLQVNPGKRPTMDNVVLELQKVLECSGRHMTVQMRGSESTRSNRVIKKLRSIIPCLGTDSLLKCHESKDSTEEEYENTRPTSLRACPEWRFEVSENSQNEADVYWRYDWRFEVIENSQNEVWRNGGCRQFSLEEILAATNQFDDSHIIGRVGEGKLYCAEIFIGSDKTPVAMKHIHGNFMDFEIEMQTMSKIQHPNIVSLLGYCYESGNKILVYEYMAKGCLSDYLKEGSRISFPWLERIKVCLSAARGLQYLHTTTDEYPKGIIHGDVNPWNIQVGENWVAKLFNLAFLKDLLRETNFTSRRGFYAPEYVMLGRVTRKIDVFAFGVVLLQVLCRKMPWDRVDESYYYDENEDLGIWAQENVDAQIRGEMSEECLTLFTDIIGKSLQVNPGKRPTMDQVVLGLQKAIECQESENLAKQLKAKDANKKSSSLSLSSSSQSCGVFDPEKEQLRQEISNLKETMRQMMQGDNNNNSTNNSGTCNK